jgi:hypothetical protein
VLAVNYRRRKPVSRKVAVISGVKSLHLLLEICAVQQETKSANPIILSMYRAPSGDINKFLKSVDIILKCLYSPKSEFIICGDININCLNENDHKQQINSLKDI